MMPREGEWRELLTAPTLVIGGGRARFWPTEMFRQTVNGIPGARLIIYEDRAHGYTFVDKRFGREVVTLLKAAKDQP
jgi:pimeloyl-ACP methyl ester carboxylesterase